MENQEQTFASEEQENAEAETKEAVENEDDGDGDLEPARGDESPVFIKSKKFNEGLTFGIFIGFMVATIICTVVFSLIIVFRLRNINNANTTGQQTSSAGAELTLGQSVTDKMNTLIGVIDYYFLYDYDKEKMAQNIYDAILSSLDDPYSVYYTAEEYQELKENTEGTYSGIGVVVTKNAETNEVTVVTPYENCPGAEAGLMEEDVILAADGVLLKELELEQAVTHIKGEEGTDVVLTIRRGEETFDVTCTRRKVDVVTVAYELLDNGIGDLVIYQFDAVTTEQFKNALEDLKSQGMKALIIDIRDNPGGRLDTVSQIADYILPEGLIVYTKDKRGNVEELRSDAACALDVPCVVLVNGNSASASEILAGAMQDYNKATIMGTQSYGKGIVQTVLSLKDGSAVKLTIEDYFTPNGNNIHGIGITPDIVVEFDKDAFLADGTDTQWDAAIEYLLEQIN